jgi:hypothetical protein
MDMKRNIYMGRAKFTPFLKRAQKSVKISYIPGKLLSVSVDSSPGLTEPVKSDFFFI